MIYILCGDNSYAIKQKLLEIKTDFIEKYSNLQIENYDGAVTDINEITNSLKAISLFEANKLVIIEDLSANSNLPKSLDDWLGQVDETTIMVLVERNIDKRSSTYKTFKKQSNFMEFKIISGPELTNWVVELVKQKKGSISRADAQYLVERVGNHQLRLSNEIHKLFVYEPKITKENINLLTEPTPNSTIFNLIDSIFSGRLDNAMRIYADQKAQQVAPQAILGMIIWQMHVICLCLAGGRMTSQEISLQTGVNNYVISKNRALADKIGVKNVKKFLDLLREIEIKSKHQTFDMDSAIKHIILRLDTYKNK